ATRQTARPEVVTRVGPVLRQLSPSSRERRRIREWGVAIRYVRIVADAEPCAREVDAGGRRALSRGGGGHDGGGERNGNRERAAGRCFHGRNATAAAAHCRSSEQARHRDRAPCHR